MFNKWENEPAVRFKSESLITCSGHLFSNMFQLLGFETPIHIEPKLTVKKLKAFFYTISLRSCVSTASSSEKVR